MFTTNTGTHVPWVPYPRGSHMERGILEAPLPCYHPPLSLTCGSWCPARGPLRSGHLQPGRGFGTRRNHSVSGACSGGQRGGAVALLPEHGVRRTVPIPQGAAPLLGVQRHLDKTRDGRKVTSQERGHQGPAGTPQGWGDRGQGAG